MPSMAARTSPQRWIRSAERAHQARCSSVSSVERASANHAGASSARRLAACSPNCACTCERGGRIELLVMLSQQPGRSHRIDHGDVRNGHGRELTSDGFIGLAPVQPALGRPQRKVELTGRRRQPRRQQGQRSPRGGGLSQGHEVVGAGPHCSWRQLAGGDQFARDHRTALGQIAPLHPRAAQTARHRPRDRPGLGAPAVPSNSRPRRGARWLGAPSQSGPSHPAGRGRAPSLRPGAPPGNCPHGDR